MSAKTLCRSHITFQRNTASATNALRRRTDCRLKRLGQSKLRDKKCIEIEERQPEMENKPRLMDHEYALCRIQKEKRWVLNDSNGAKEAAELTRMSMNLQSSMLDFLSA